MKPKAETAQLIALAQRLEDIKPELLKHAEALSGTKGWTAYGAELVRAGARNAVEMLLSADEKHKTFTVQDRIKLTLLWFPEGQQVGVTLKVARSTSTGKSDESLVFGPDLDINKPLDARTLLLPSVSFWLRTQKFKFTFAERTSMSHVTDFKRLSGLLPMPGLNEGTEVADTIAKQMGGIRALKLMLGATVYALDNGLKFKWPNKERSKGNVCVVTLDPDDTYTMEFFNGSKSVAKFDGLHFPQLVPTFEKQTGWYLTFGRKPQTEAVNHSFGEKPTAKALEKEFDLSPEDAERLADALNTSQNQKMSAALRLANDLLDAHGVEAIRDPGNDDDAYWGDAVASYVNMGDSYVSTILYDVKAKKVAITSYGDWVEKFGADLP